MKYSVRYNLKGKARDTSDNRQHIRVRVSWASRRVEMLTGNQVPPDYWDADGQRVRPVYRHGKDETGATINKQLAALTAHIDQLFARYQVEQRTPEATELQQELKVYFGTATSTNATDCTIFECIDRFVDTMGEQNGWTKGTLTKFHTIKKHLQTFAPKLTFSDLTEDGLQRFMRYLMKSGLRNTTIAKDLDILRWFLRWAYRHGYTDNNAFETFRPKLKGTDGNSKEIIYLEWDELMTLFDYDFGEKHQGLAAVRDVFCFCCFTGLRYSDAAKLRTSDIYEDYISVVTQKTSDGLRIELNDFSRAILDRRRPFQLSKGNKTHRALPVINNQKMNDYLKEIGELVGIDKPIRIVYYAGSERIENVYSKYELLTTHCARRTFVVNALRLGIPAEVIMKWTGHSDFSAMKPYVKIVDELKEKEMTKFNLLSGNGSPKSPRK